MSAPAKIRLADKAAQITEHWRPKIIGELNGQEVKLAKLKGEFVWHLHEAEDELFLVVSGHLRMEFRDRAVLLEPGEMIIVPRGTEHRPVADDETCILLFEPAGVRNTGNVEDAKLTAPMGVKL